MLFTTKEQRAIVEVKGIEVLMKGSDAIDVIVVPPDIIDKSIIGKVAVIIEKDVFAAKLLLSSSIPRVAAKCNSAEEAEIMLKSLKDLGLFSLTCSDSWLRQPFAAHFKSTSMKINNGSTVFCDHCGVEKFLVADEVSLILYGVLERKTENEKTTKKMKFSIGKTILAGGIPVWQGVEEKTKDVNTLKENFIRLFTPISQEPVVEIFQYNFDYSFLGSKMTFSSESNIGLLASELKRLFPCAAFDNKLTKPGIAGNPSASFADSFDINCKLLLLNYMELRSADR
jgi:hypothetical protein